jgi:hypothetical protein
MDLLQTRTQIETPVRIYSRCRPLRVAYLLDQSASWTQFLEGIIAEAYSRWGGVRTLIVPITENRIADAYWHWLKWWDPDLVYSYPEPSDELILRIAREIQPIWFLQHRLPGALGQLPSSPMPRLKAPGLTSLTVLPFLKVPRGFLANAPTKLINRYPQWKDDGFVCDNFGTHCDSFSGFPPSPAINQLVECLNLLPPAAPRDRWHHPALGSEIESVTALLQLMTNDHSIIGMYDLASWHATGPLLEQTAHHQRYIRNHPWSASLSLIIGDQFIDRIAFWNSRLLANPWQGGTRLSAMRLPAGRLIDRDFLRAFLSYLNSRRWMMPFACANQGSITIRSGSLPEDDLQSFADELGAELRCAVRCEPISELTALCPSKEQLEDNYWPLREEEGQYLATTVAAINAPRPPHFTYTTGAAQEFAKGTWITDLKMERHRDFSQYTNLRHWWMLPKRIGLPPLFLAGDTPKEAKVTCEGYLAVPASQGEPPTWDQPKIMLRLPEDDETFNAILHERQWYSPADLRHQRCDAPAFVHSQPSNIGRYFTGALELVGGPWNAFQLFSCRFWRSLFLDLGAPAKADEPALLPEIAKRLRARHSNFDPNSEQDWQRLANTVVVEAGRIRLPTNRIGYAELFGRWKAERDEGVKALTSADQKSEALRYADFWFEESLKSLCGRGVLAQGHEWKCPKCLYSNWHSIGDIALTLRCAVCRKEQQVPPDFRWHFRLNDFLASGIREHGLLALLWVTGYLLDGSRESFYFLPASWLYRTYPDPKQRSLPQAELDIICVSDGRFIIGEAKESVRDFTDQRVENLIAVAKELTPDLVLLASLEQKSDRLEKLASRMQQELTAVGSQVRSLVPNPTFDAPTYILPSV